VSAAVAAAYQRAPVSAEREDSFFEYIDTVVVGGRRANSFDRTIRRGHGHCSESVTFDKKLSYRRDSARWRSSHRSRSFKVTDLVQIESPHATSYQ